VTLHAASLSLGNQQLLGEWLHSLSQPLTTLHCALELSAEGGASQASVLAALKQTETVIAMVRLMREYLSFEDGQKKVTPIALMPILRSVREDLSSVAAVQGVDLRLAGMTELEVPVEESRLRSALQYLIQDVIERQMPGNKVLLVVRDTVRDCRLRAQGEQAFCDVPAMPERPRFVPASLAGSSDERSRIPLSAGATMRRVRLAIASLALETVGATVTVNEDTPGFSVTIPRMCHWRL